MSTLEKEYGLAYSRIIWVIRLKVTLESKVFCSPNSKLQNRKLNLFMIPAY